MNRYAEIPPVVDPEVVIRGAGEVQSGGAPIPVTHISARRLKYRPDQPWKVEIRIPDMERDEVMRVIKHTRAHPTIRGTTDQGRSLEIPDYDCLRYPLVRPPDGYFLFGHAYEIRLGLETAHAVPDKLVLTGHLTDNAVCLPLVDFLWPHPDGTVSGRRERRARSIPTSLGNLRLWHGYTGDEITLGGKKASAQKSLSVVQLRLRKPKRSMDLPHLAELFEQEVDDLLPILTLFSRRHVGCDRIELFADLSEPPKVIQGEVWRSAPQHQEDRWPASLVDPKALPDEAIAEAVRTLRTHPARDLLISAIYFVSEAGQGGHVPVQVLWAFTALEAVVGVIQPKDQSETISLKHFKTLTRALKATIKEQATTLSLSDTQRDEIYQKLGELRRRPIVRRIVEVCETLAVDWGPIFPNVQSLERALTAAFGRRNMLYHKGHMEDVGACARDARRISALAECLIFFSLGGSYEWMSSRTYLDIHQMPTDVVHPWRE